MMIRVLVVEDSPVIREFLIYTLSEDKGIEVLLVVLPTVRKLSKQ